MELQDFKSKFLGSWVQFVLMDEAGNLLDTCNTLFNIPKSFGNLYDEIPFLESISQLLIDLKKGEEISFPCINVELLSFEGFCDYVFHKIDHRGQTATLWILMNFSDHYKNLIGLQQQRNESVIQKELLEIEKKNAILAGELLRYKNEELKRVQKLKTDFFSKISHEVRTPINGILGIAKLLREQKDPEIIQEYAGIIYETSKHLSSIVNDVLDLSKIESNKISFQKTNFDVRFVVNAAMSAFVYLGKEKKIEVISAIKEDVPGMVKGDPVRLSQVLYNLLSNSFKFTHKGKVSLNVSLHAKHVETAEIQFEVKDTGIGISEENVKKIFEPYQQANSDTSVSYGGTGLGLHIVKQLLEQQKGSIEVSSKPEVGTIFRFILPFEIVDHGSAVKNKKPSIVTKKLNILVGEDNPLNQKILSEFINNWGFKCHLVENGLQVINKVGLADYDLIILDYKMPEMDGLQTLQRMRSEFGKNVNEIPVILFTGEIGETVLAEFGNLGVKSVLHKPIEPESLLEAIKAIFGERDLAGGFNLTYAIEMTGGNKRLIHDMINIFIHTMPGEMKKMRSLAMSSDYQTLNKTVHKIKPNFHYMGIEKARGVFDSLENELAGTKDNTQVVERINELQQMAETAIQRLKVERQNWVN